MFLYKGEKFASIEELSLYLQVLGVLVVNRF